MANKFLKRRFTLREIAFLIVLLLVLFVGLYFLLVYYPIKDRVDALRIEQDVVDKEIADATVTKADYDAMQKELEEIYKLEESERTYMPDHSTARKTLTDEFGRIFGTIVPSINYDDQRTPAEDDTVYIRNVSITFEAESYDHARELLDKLMNIGTPRIRSQMTRLYFGLSGGASHVQEGKLTVSCNILFYELL